MSWLIPTVLGIGSSLFGQHKQNQQAKAQQDAANAQSLQDYQIAQARRAQQMTRYKVNLALIRSWLEQHPNIARRAPKEYLDAVYNPQTTPMPAYHAPQSTYTSPSTLGTIASAGVNTLKDLWPKPPAQTPLGQPAAPSGPAPTPPPMISRTPAPMPDWSNQGTWGQPK